MSRIIRNGDRRIVGQKITGLNLNSFSDGRGGRTTNPVITLSNGVKLYFQTQETEGSDYGTEIIVNETGMKQ